MDIFIFGLVAFCVIMVFLVVMVITVGSRPNDEEWASTPEDGWSGGKRGRIWSETERAERTGKPSADVTALKVVSGACPPHKPEYDATVNETYCEKCLERLPNE